jgi:hypothetical protein
VHAGCPRSSSAPCTLPAEVYRGRVRWVREREDSSIVL